MIPTKTVSLEVDNLPAQREVAFSIGDPTWVMRSMSNLYSNVEGAVAREYSTNAWDANVEAGNADIPIKVTLPSKYNPYFTVQDYGVGMSTDELCNTYTSFGTSTKRQSNSYNGMYGFGSKSAVAYTNQFTVVSIKDGRKSHAVISRKEDWSITLKIVAVSATDEPNGTTVTVPVHNPEEFAHKAKDFYRFWLPGTVLVDNKQPEQAVGERIDDQLYFSANESYSYVVMGNVAYRVENPDALFRNSRMHRISFVAYVPLGSVHHTPAREALDYTPQTKEYLQKVISDFEDKIILDVTKKIENAPSHQEAWKLWHFWRNKLGHPLFKDVKYKGEKFPYFIGIPGSTQYTVPYPNQYNARYNTRRVTSINLPELGNTLIVYDMLTDVSTLQKRKVKEFITLTKSPKFATVIFTDRKPDMTWLTEYNVVSWEYVKEKVKELTPKVVKPSVPRVKRPVGVFDYYQINSDTNNNLNYIAEEPIPSTVKKIYYVTISDAKKYGIRDAMKVLDFDGKTVVVRLAVNRIEKFVRDNPGAEDFVAYAKSKIELDGEKLLNDKVKRALKLSNEVVYWLRALRADKIDDPLWQEYRELLNHAEFNSEYEKNLELARQFGMYYQVTRYQPRKDDKNLLDRYPLLRALSRYDSDNKDIKEDIISYVNMKYKEGLKV